MLKVKPLEYPYDALQPIISAETLHLHHDKHYAGYVEKTNELLPVQWSNKSLEEIIVLARKQQNIALFNQAAQVWNHEFFFKGLKSDSSNMSESLKSAIVRDFGNLEALRSALVNAAIRQFGSGWVWLVLKEGKLAVVSTSNAETLVGLTDCRPLWVLDVWEHAYYLDYQNRRQEYATHVVDKVVNWQFVADNLDV